MSFITAAYAQSATTDYVATGLKTSDWAIMIIGVIIALISLTVIYRNIAVTTGHALILGAGVALICLPFIANFEWSDKGFKFARREDATDLAAKVIGLAEDTVAIRSELKTVTEALQAANLRIATLEKPAGSPPLASPNFNVEDFKKPTLFEDLLKRNELGILKGNASIDQLQDLKKAIQSPEGMR